MIRIIDLETSGLPPDAEVVEAAYVDIMRDAAGKPVIAGIWRSFVDLGFPIPPEASAIHHITDGMVAGAPEWPAVRGKLLSPNVVAYAAYNATFEKSFIDTGAVPMLDIYKIALKLWPECPKHSNQTVRYFLKLKLPEWGSLWPSITSREELSPHRAAGDAITTAYIFMRALDMMTPTEMGAVSRRPALLPRFHFGEHVGKPLSAIPHSYLRWIVDRSNFSEADVLFTAEHELNRRQAVETGT